MLNKRVSFLVVAQNGSYAEYMITNKINVVPIPDNIPYNIAATSVVNPLTAFGLY